MAILNEEQSMIRDMAQSWVVNEQPVTAYRKMRDSGNTKGYEDATFAQIVDMGWTGVLVPEAFGGSELGYVSLGLILEQMGHNLVASPLALSALGATSALVIGGSEEQKQKYLPALVSGEAVGTLAVDDAAFHDLDRIETSAKKEGDVWVLNGLKKFVPETGGSTFLVAAAKTDSGLALFLVDRDADGLSIEHRSVADARSHGAVTFDNVKLSADALLGDENGRALIEQVLDRMRIGASAEMLGMCDKAFNDTLEYLKTREQFDQPLASFQALQHRMANLYAELELMRSVVEHALTMLDKEQDADKIAAQAALTKCIANDTTNLMTREMLQLHGGIGMTDEHDSGFYLKRARTLETAWGGSSAMSDRYGRLALEV